MNEVWKLLEYGFLREMHVSRDLKISFNSATLTRTSTLTQYFAEKFSSTLRSTTKSDSLLRSKANWNELSTAIYKYEA